MGKQTEPEAEAEPEVGDSREQELEKRRRCGKRAGLGQIDADLFACSDTPLTILHLCVRRGATLDQIRSICI